MSVPLFQHSEVCGTSLSDPLQENPVSRIISSKGRNVCVQPVHHLGHLPSLPSMALGAEGGHHLEAAGLALLFMCRFTDKHDWVTTENGLEQ